MSKASLKSNLAPDLGLRATRAGRWTSRGVDKQVLSLRETIARACLYASGIAGLWLSAFLALKISGGTWPCRRMSAVDVIDLTSEVVSFAEKSFAMER